MAQIRVPEQWEGRSLQQIFNEVQRSGGYIPRIDLVANMLGVDQNEPLTRDKRFTVNTSGGSGEAQFLAQQFQTVTAEDLAKEFQENYVKSIQQEIDRESKFIEQYLEQNPFAFDEELARQSATAQYEPYYSELLQDYLVDVDQKRETVQDERQLSENLYRLDSSARSRAYDRAVSQAEQGFAGSGMFYSGIKERNLGQREVEYLGDTERAQDAFSTQQRGFDRTLEGYDTAVQRQTRDVGREQQTAVEGGILQRRQEAAQPYYATLEQAYKRQFPSAQQSVSNYLPSSFLNQL